MGENSADKDIRKSPVFQKLLADAHNMEEDLRVFNAEWRDFLTRDDTLARTVLRAHLIVEHFLDLYVRACNPAVTRWDEARLTFAQKLALADNPGASLHFLMPGLRCLNRIRNQLVHNLQTTQEDINIQPIRQVISVWRKALGDPVPEGLDLIIEMALQASGWMHGTVCMIQRHAPEAGMPGLQAWYRAKTDTDNRSGVTESD